jgi:hypothetical protein
MQAGALSNNAVISKGGDTRESTTGAKTYKRITALHAVIHSPACSNRSCTSSTRRLPPNVKHHTRAATTALSCVRIPGSSAATISQRWGISTASAAASIGSPRFGPFAHRSEAACPLRRPQHLDAGRNWPHPLQHSSEYFDRCRALPLAEID